MSTRNKSWVKSALFSVVLLVVSAAFAIGLAEAVLRVKNSDMQNYDIEMWRYAKELKFVSENPLLGHEHVPSKSALLQSVVIRTNEWGLRGSPVASNPPERRILFLGSSVTMGWGVREEDIVTQRLQRMFSADGQNVEVLNAGIGNYNAARYVERFLTRLAALNPTDIVVHCFPRDAEILEAGGGNVLLRHSQLAVTTWTVANRYFGETGERSLVEHYRRIYQPDSPGFREMAAQLGRLADYARARGIRLYLAMTPDVHDVVDYKLGFIHEQVRKVAAELGYTYIDLLPSLRNLTPKELWSLPGDPHPNALGHQRMAQAIYPYLKLPVESRDTEAEKQ
jgi:lysophospholipase L1-like esterase